MEALDLRPTVGEGTYVSSFARVHPEVKVGSFCFVWQFASVLRGSVLGDGCVVASCACVDGARLGRNVRVGHGALISPGAVIEDDAFVGPNASICNDIWPRVDRDGWHDLKDLISGAVVAVRIKRGASVGANAVVLPGVTIGERAVVAAGAVASRDVPAGHVLRRNGAVDPFNEHDKRANRARRVS